MCYFHCNLRNSLDVSLALVTSALGNLALGKGDGGTRGEPVRTRGAVLRTLHINKKSKHTAKQNSVREHKTIASVKIEVSYPQMVAHVMCSGRGGTTGGGGWKHTLSDSVSE